MGLDDLRKSALDTGEGEQDYSAMVAKGASGDERLFGMTAVERMFVSIGCFLVTSLFGFALLLLLDKIAI